MTDSILIFEDEGITSLHLRTLLTDWGFSVSAVADEAEKAADLIEADPDLLEDILSPIETGNINVRP